jgi:hypothetical protein
MCEIVVRDANCPRVFMGENPSNPGGVEAAPDLMIIVT